MPLFFILSGYTFKEVPINNLLKSTIKDFKRLFIPCIIARIIILIGNCIIDNSSFFLELKKLLLCLVWGNHYGTFFGISFPSIGRIWFLPALFWSKTFYRLFLSKYNVDTRVPFFTLMSLCSMILGLHGIILPQNLDMIFVCLLFMEIGYSLKDFDFEKINCWIFLCLFSAWTYLSYNQEMWINMNQRTYHGYGLCIIVSLLGCICIFKFCKAIEELKLCKPLIFFGQHSLILLVIHSIAPYFYKGTSITQKLIDITVQCTLVLLFVFFKNILKKNK